MRSHLRTWVWIVLCVVAIGAGSVGGFALGSDHTPRDAPAGYTLFTVRPSELSWTVPTTVTIHWDAAAKLDVPAGGRLTGELPRSRQVASGDVLMRVDGQPVFAVEGAVPAWRPIALGDSGPDVTQLKKMLRSKGYDPSDSDVFDPSARLAWREWLHANQGMPEDDVALGQVVFIRDMPARVSPATGVRLGAPLPAPAVLVVRAKPSMSVAVPLAIAGQVKPGMTVQVSLPKGTYDARVGGLLPNSGDGPAAELKSDGLNCKQLSCPGTPEHDAVATGSIVLVPATRGLAVPGAAVTPTSNSEGTLVRADGSQVTVRLTATGEGMAIVEGIPDGAVIRVPSGVDTH